MSRSSTEQLGLAEALLAKIQHSKIGIPDELRREIRDYFSEYERGQLVSQEREDTVDLYACGFYACQELALYIVDEHDGFQKRIGALEPHEF